MMVIEAGAVPHIAALLSDVFDIRKEVILFNNIPLCCQSLHRLDSEPVKKSVTISDVLDISLLCSLETKAGLHQMGS